MPLLCNVSRSWFWYYCITYQAYWQRFLHSSTWARIDSVHLEYYTCSPKGWATETTQLQVPDRPNLHEIVEKKKKEAIKEKHTKLETRCTSLSNGGAVSLWDKFVKMYCFPHILVNHLLSWPLSQILGLSHIDRTIVLLHRPRQQSPELLHGLKVKC